MQDCTSRPLPPRFAILLLSALHHDGAASNRSFHLRPFGWAACLFVSCSKSRITQEGHLVPHLLDETRSEIRGFVACHRISSDIRSFVAEFPCTIPSRHRVLFRAVGDSIKDLAPLILKWLNILDSERAVEGIRFLWPGTSMLRKIRLISSYQNILEIPPFEHEEAVFPRPSEHHQNAHQVWKRLRIPSSNLLLAVVR